MIYFSADLHLNHDNIIKYCKRPVPEGDTQAHNQWLKNFFVNFKQGDTLYLLGDIWFRPSRMEIKEFFQLLKDQGVTLYIVVGNHDEKILNMLYEVYREVFGKAGPSYIKHYIKLTFKEGEYPFTKVILSHYPFESWDGSYHNSLHLHGHCHGNLPTTKANRYDVGIDVAHKLFTFDDFVAKQSEEGR